jgi:DUF1680 family protein
MPNRFQALPLGAIKPKGWLLQQLRDDLAGGYGPHLDQLTPRAASDLFKHRIGASQSQFAWWDSETRGNWLWGYTMMAGLAQDPDHLARARSLLDDLLATQDPDGYLGIYSPDWRYQHPPGENGELWGQSRALLPLLAAYELSGEPGLLAAVESAVKLTMAHYGPGRARYFTPGHDPEVEIIGLTHGLCYVDVLAQLHRLTGEAAYKDFGLWLFADFCAMLPPYANDDLAPANLRQAAKPWSGHAVHTAEHLRALFWAAAQAENGDWAPEMAAARRKLSLYLLPSGALIGDESLHGLPGPDSGYEYCTLTELLFSLAKGLEAGGDAWYGDRLEVLAFNAAQGSRLADGRGVAYLNSDTCLSADAARPDSYSFLHGGAGRFKYSPTHEDIACCCNPNALRLLPHYISHLWMAGPDENSLVAALYGACQVQTRLQGVNLSIEESTDYPFSNEVVITLWPESPLSFDLYLRRPAWAQGLKIDSQGARIDSQGDYMRLSKKWAAGDRLIIGFEHQARLEHYPTGEAAVFYGPLQFALPIPHHHQALKTYPLDGFYDYALQPQEIEAAYHIPIIDAGLANYGLSLSSQPGGNMLRPWQSPPWALRLADRPGLEFWPLGASPLRRAAFPLRKLR